MPTTDQRLAALESVLFPPEPSAPAAKPAPTATLVVGKKKYTATTGTLEELCRDVGCDDKVIEAASKLGASSAKVDGDMLKPL